MRSLIKFPITILELGGSKDYVHLRYQINLGVGEHLPTKQVELKYSVLIEWDWRARQKIFGSSWVMAPDRAQRSDSVKQHFILQLPLFLSSFSSHIVGLHKGSRVLLGGVCPILFNKSARGTVRNISYQTFWYAVSLSIVTSCAVREQNTNKECNR